MMESGSRQLRASLISARILRCAYYFGTYIGAISIYLQKSQFEETLVVQRGIWYKYIYAIIRISLSILYAIKHQRFLSTRTISQLQILVYIRLFACLTYAVIIMVFKLCIGDRVANMANRYIRIFNRVNALPAKRNVGFGEKRELILLFFKMVALFLELYFNYLICLRDVINYNITGVACEIYTNISNTFVSWTCFLGYLSVGALYDRTNRYVRNELRQEFQDLQNCRGGQPSRRQLRAAEERLNEVLEIYDEIQRVAMEFHKLFEYNLALLLLSEFMNMALVLFFILQHYTYSALFSIVAVKIFLDLVLPIMAIHGACSSSRVVRRLSLENYYNCDRNDWHMKLEMFLNRLNYYEFKVRPLGLFEVSNQFLLVIFSGMVAYLTVTLQYTLQKQYNLSN